MKTLTSYIKKRGNGVCATLPKAILDIFKIPLDSKFEIEVKVVKNIKTIILREVK